MILKGHVCGYICSWAGIIFVVLDSNKKFVFRRRKSVTYVYPSSVRSSAYNFPSSVRSSAYNLEVRKPAGKISELRKQTVSSPTILSLWELNACWIQLPKQLMREGQLMAKQVHTSSITHYVETAGPLDKLIPLLNTTAPWGWHKLSPLDEGTAMSVATNISADPSFKASQKWWQKLLTTQQRNIQANKSRNNNTPLEMKCPKSKKRYKHLASFGSMEFWW